MIESLDIRSSGEYRNRRIGNYLKELVLTEGRNTGIPKAIDALKENNKSSPTLYHGPRKKVVVSKNRDKPRVYSFHQSKPP